MTVRKITVRTFGAGAASAAFLGSVLLAAPAQAEENDGPQHCWTNVDTSQSLCAESPDALAVAMYERYGITVQERPGEDLPDAITSPGERAKRAVDGARSAKARAAAPTPRAGYLLVKGFSQTSYRGDSQTWTTYRDEEPCRVAGSYPYGQYEYLHNYLWNDRMYSYQTAPKCRLNVWSDTVFRGTKRGPYGNSTSLGILNGEVSSMSIVK